jgi:1,4-alpha-glucan branching enzyme
MAIDNSKKGIKRRKVTFSIEAVEAKEVLLMGDFNKWNPKKHPMKKDRKGCWTKAVIIPTGTYEYKFRVDGEWRIDPLNERKRINCFGTHNSLLLMSTL